LTFGSARRFHITDRMTHVTKTLPGILMRQNDVHAAHGRG
jgi:hypothetical protein